MRAPGGDDPVGALLARCRFPPAGTEVTCAVSGGADSSALLVLATAAGCDATAVHVDHGLRPGSADEARVVEALAARLGARFRSVTVEVPEGPDLEARARDARRAVLPPGTLYGHTADVSFVGHVRDMVKFNSVDELTAAITADVEKVREILGIKE